MKQFLNILFSTAIFLIFFSAQFSIADTHKTDHLPRIKNSDSRILKQPNGPFAVMLFNEGALGLNIGIIYYDPMGVPANGKWWLSERFWSDRTWSSDVTNILWGFSGQNLYISTSRIYGDGSIFRLNLINKSAERIFPKVDIKSTDILFCEIICFNQQTREFTIKVTYESEKTELVEIPMD